jgi:hypothetical protein
MEMECIDLAELLCFVYVILMGARDIWRPELTPPGRRVLAIRLRIRLAKASLGWIRV